MGYYAVGWGAKPDYTKGYGVIKCNAMIYGPRQRSRQALPFTTDTNCYQVLFYNPKGPAELLCAEVAHLGASGQTALGTSYAIA